MKIGIDARFLTHPQKGGFKTYTENLVLALAQLDKKNDYVLYLDRQPLRDSVLPSQPNFRHTVIPGNHKLYGMPWREQYALPRQIKKDNLDLFHSPCLTAPIVFDTPLVVTIHDMIWYHPDRYSKQKMGFHKRGVMRWYYQTVPQIAIRKARAVITVSEAAKQSILAHMRIQNDQIIVTHEAASEFYRPLGYHGAQSYIAKKYQVNSSFILGIGSADPRKNIKTLIQAYAVLPESFRNDYHLVVVCNHKSLVLESLKEVEQSGILKCVHFLEEVNDQELAYLYNLAALFVFPSLEEGFGLPLLEAMGCGTPVLAADNSSIPEIVGDAALRFNAEDVRKLAELISKVLSNPTLQLEMRERGIARAADFSWKRCGMETIAVYKKVIEGENKLSSVRIV
ncbi:MAG: hypothetical protein DCC56_09635 [Anaerolineae bacterium]|nr:MAG: hypothetical protein DCC56_09635 [Anaerolineae bacterium]WKZ45150.1 MAG: glycosyltransferase family 1 protein [Anaerolineales bacterium]